MPEQPQVLSGSNYLRAGWQAMWQPGLRRYVLIPAALNTVLLISLISWAGHTFNVWLGQMMNSLPEWLGFLQWLLWPLFALLILVMLFFTFSMLANLIGSPFYALLAEKLALRQRGEAPQPGSWRDWVWLVPHSIGRELAKLVYYFPRLLALLLLSLVPLANVLATPLLLVFGVWMMAVQYLDYQADNDGVSLGQQLGWMRQRRSLMFSFGLPVYVGSLIPLLNVLIMPAAVAGSTLLWVEHYTRQPKLI
ncbi:sulfate transporter CysZ [Halopseudomonas salegens]|uniref:CysZ protein n=1 Tax=Halopseudomonas salegens TaxID=1434072 RepID=A0A1H2GXC2_9GAMM|nr:sulfate transporter CysZ [Halopseudomonas salegens]SDU24145.1 CysZ protein [Halopseudomonas salegens]